MASKDENKEFKSDPFAETEVRFGPGRPWIAKDANAPVFRMNQEVYVDLGAGFEGPYVVVKVNTNTTTPMYELETKSGQTVYGGQEVDQNRLKKA